MFSDGGVSRGLVRVIVRWLRINESSRIAVEEKMEREGAPSSMTASANVD